jgi:hypothetical protein
VEFRLLAVRLEVCHSGWWLEEITMLRLNMRKK